MLPILATIVFQSGSEQIQVSVDGVQRDALVFAPSKNSAHPPVVFAFHGHGGNSNYAARAYDFQHAFPEAVVVYPQGLPTVTPLVDRQGRKPGWDMSNSEQNKDIRFFDVLYKAVMAKYQCDPKHVYAMGHSNGGGFMYTLWGMRPNLFAAFASAEAAGARRFSLTPKPIFITIGSEDKIVLPALQRASLGVVLKANGSQGSQQPYGGKAVVYNGDAPTVVWNYDGGHQFQRDAIPWMVKFFRSLPQN